MPKLGLGLSLVSPKVSNPVYDPEALVYFNAVQAADGQNLEKGVKSVLNSFVLGCKADAIWNNIIACCILAGARTITGALVPLKGSAPTNNNFVGGDYNRKYGLIGNDSNKYLNTNYNNSDTTNFPQNDSHMSCYITQSQTDGSGTLIGGINSIGSRLSIHYNTPTMVAARNRATSTSSISLAPIGFQGCTRNNSANFNSRFNTSAGVSTFTTGAVSGVPAADPFGVLAAGNGTQFSNARISFYSIGRSTNLAALQTRVDNLMYNLATAIP